MNPAELKALEEAVAKLKEDPTLAYDPAFASLKDLLTSWGGKIPPAEKKKEEPKPEPAKAPEPAEEESEEEPEEPEEPEEEDPERLPEDPEPFPEKGATGVELTDEQLDEQGEIKQKAVEALEDGDLQKALDGYTEVIKMGNPTAMVYSKRAEILLKLKRPNACIADCNSAVDINPDSAKAFKIRGKAHRKLGHWEEAHKDLSQGQSLDFDDDTADVQKVVAEKNKKINERKVRERLRQEKKDLKERKARRAAAQKAYEEQKKAEASMGGGFPGGFPGGMGGMGGMPGMPPGVDPSMFAGLLQDPELMAAMSDPKMMQAFQDIMANPANMAKYQNDPEVMALVQKLMSKMGGMGGMGGGIPGMDEMFGGMGGAGAEDAGAASSGPTVDEVDGAGGPSVEEID